jgi:hypothetical protein
MSRRNSGGLVTGLLHIGAKAPWQVSVIAAVALFVTLHLVASIEVPSTTTTAMMGSFVVRQMLRSFVLTWTRPDKQCPITFLIDVRTLFGQAG